MSEKDETPDRQDVRQPAEKPVSLHPLGFKEALSDLLKVHPENNRSSTDEKGGRDNG